MKKAVLTVATIATLVSNVLADDNVLNKKAEIASIIGIGSFENDASIFAAVSKLNSNDYGEMTIEASKDNIDINLYKPVKIFEDVVSVGFESGYLKFKDYDPAGSVGLATTLNYFIDAPYLPKQQIGIYLKTGFDLAFGGVSRKEINSLYRTTLAAGCDRFVAGVSYKRINLLNTNQDNRVNFFVGYSFTW